ncbi:hypothetical protein [Reichenbachiella versicolor]|uniref:hypothetical protein n=1 Tax=Reichenbachiella versicolor TaxID=1821036 RepID=UPI000D6E6810|nr:hypothetical protein [Reichenbachiella versicolor]
MKDRIFLASLFLISVLIWSCQEDQEYLEYDPSVLMKFINQDSIDALTGEGDTIYILNDSIDSLTKLISQQNVFISDTSDNIFELGDSVEDERLTSEERAKVQAELDRNIKAGADLSDFKDSLDLVKDSLSNNLAFWNGVVNTMESGSVKIISIVNLAEEESPKVEYFDSLTVWPIPLSMNDEYVHLQLSIGDEDVGVIQQYTLEIEYSLSTQVDEKGIVTRVPDNIDIVSHDFKSKINNCQTSCNGGTPNYTVHF